MKAKVIQEIHIDLLVEVECPKCEHINTFVYFYDDCLGKMKKTEKCKECEVKLSFTVGEE